MKTQKEILKALAEFFQKEKGLKVDGIVGPQTLAALFPITEKEFKEIPFSEFDKGSASRLLLAHPLLQKVMNEARKKAVFQILDSQRGKAAQEKAFKEGHSKARFGKSAHNYAPAIALDVTPLPLNWNDKQSFIDLSKVILATAKELKVPIRWGGDWNMDGSTKDGWDFPHYELHPWRNYATKLIGVK